MKLPRRLIQWAVQDAAFDDKLRPLRATLDWAWEQLVHLLNDFPKINLTGTATVSGASASVTVTFATAEPDASYFLAVTPTVPTGGPAAGSNRILSISKTASGFTLNVEAAPAGAATMAFDYAVIR